MIFSNKRKNSLFVISDVGIIIINLCNFFISTSIF